jgi:acetolactate synthase-1/2/3 large subunit
MFHLLLEKIKIPTLVTWSAIDVMSHDHMLFFGSPGVYGQRAANFIFQKSDLIIVLGSRLGLPQTGYDIKELARNAKIIMVDVDLTENKSFVHTFVHSDCKDFCNQLLGYSHDCSGWIDECKTIREQFPIIEDSHVDGEFPNSYKIIDSISRFLKPNHVVVTDMGTALLSGHQAIHIKHYGTKMFSSYGLGEMGYGLPAAFGAGIAAPEKEIICLNCDGGMMMNLQELQTIIQHGLNIKIIIFNNDGYLMIKHTQKMLFNGEYTAVNKSTGIVLPDYIKLTKAFGYETYQIKSWSDFDTYFPEVMNCKTPVVCEIFMPPEQDFIPKVKGVLQKNGSIFAPPIEEMSPLISLSTIQNVMQNEISTKSMIIERPIHE